MEFHGVLREEREENVEWCSQGMHEISMGET
jgi:hypothetical protein